MRFGRGRNSHTTGRWRVFLVAPHGTTAPGHGERTGGHGRRACGRRHVLSRPVANSGGNSTGAARLAHRRPVSTYNVLGRQPTPQRAQAHPSRHSPSRARIARGIPRQLHRGDHGRARLHHRANNRSRVRRRFIRGPPPLFMRGDCWWNAQSPLQDRSARGTARRVRRGPQRLSAPHGTRQLRAADHNCDSHRSTGGRFCASHKAIPGFG
jgi:hypothetical protein